MQYLCGVATSPPPPTPRALRDAHFNAARAVASHMANTPWQGPPPAPSMVGAVPAPPPWGVPGTAALTGGSGGDVAASVRVRQNFDEFIDGSPVEPRLLLVYSSTPPHAHARARVAR